MVGGVPASGLFSFEVPVHKRLKIPRKIQPENIQKKIILKDSGCSIFSNYLFIDKKNTSAQLLIPLCCHRKALH